MKLSTRTCYGVRAIFDLAYQRAERAAQAVQAKDIARREAIPLRYLEQIFQDLKRAGLVEARRGPRGGYYLTRSAAEIRLGEVVRALQGPIEALFTIECDRAAAEATARPDARAVTATVWQDLARSVSAWFDGVSLGDLVKRGEALGVEREPGGTPMYFI